MKTFKNLTRNKIKTKMLLFLLYAVVVFTACSNDGNGTPPAPVPSLSGISPTSGPKTTIVTINGSNFGTSTNAVTVFFNDVEAVVQSVADDRITAIVPPRAFTGAVKVVINGMTLTGPEFIYVLTNIQVSTLAGSTPGFADATGVNAQFSFPVSVAVDTQGIVYVADLSNHSIRKVTPDGVVSTLAGSTPGFAEGTGINAQFDSPSGVTVDDQGNIYVADAGNHRIRKITPSGVVSTLAGSTEGFEEGNGANAKFSFPRGVAIDSIRNVYVADTENHKIRKVTPNGVVSTLAGSTLGFTEGNGANAQFSLPSGIAIDSHGNLYVSDSGNHKIRKVTPSGAVSTLAGSVAGFADGIGTDAQFSSLREVAVDAHGNIYLADRKNHKIRKVTPNGAVSTFAGSTEGFAEGSGADAQFYFPYGVAVDDQGNVYVADAENNRIRKIVQD